jgi:mono/diheme cytochrome c family protein
MSKFIAEIALGIVVVSLASFCYVRLGFVDPRADIAVGSLESRIAMPSLDAAVDRRAPQNRNPLQPTEANLTAGIKVYQANCASCHGDIGHPRGPLAEALYPRAPQFAEDTPDMPENQNYYIIAHGIRLSGMPAWKASSKRAGDVASDHSLESHGQIASAGFGCVEGNGRRFSEW